MVLPLRQTGNGDCAHASGSLKKNRKTAAVGGIILRVETILLLQCGVIAFQLQADGVGTAVIAQHNIPLTANPSPIVWSGSGHGVGEKCVAVQLNVDGYRNLLFFRSGLQRISYDPRHVRVEMLKTQAFFLQRNFLKVLKCTAMTRTIFAAIALLLVSAAPQDQTPNARPRASDLGLKVGVLPTGPLDAITDVAGVEVGHTTIIRGDDIRTGVTATLPQSGTNRSIGIPSSKLPGLMLKIRFMQP